MTAKEKILSEIIEQQQDLIRKMFKHYTNVNLDHAQQILSIQKRFESLSKKEDEPTTPEKEVEQPEVDTFIDNEQEETFPF